MARKRPRDVRLLAPRAAAAGPWNQGSTRRVSSARVVACVYSAVEASLKAKLERCTTLPTLPAVAVRVLELCQRENLDLSEIAKLVGHDPALAAKMLKTVNSPAFALRQEVRTL